MVDIDIVAEIRRRGVNLNRGRDSYTGGPKRFRHLDNNREAAYPWLSDAEIAGEVRMLMRDDIMFEAVVCAARDRILHLSQENERLRGMLIRADQWISTQPDHAAMCAMIREVLKPEL